MISKDGSWRKPSIFGVIEFVIISTVFLRVLIYNSSHD